MTYIVGCHNKEDWEQLKKFINLRAKLFSESEGLKFYIETHIDCHWNKKFLSMDDIITWTKTLEGFQCWIEKNRLCDNHDWLFWHGGTQHYYECKKCKLRAYGLKKDDDPDMFLAEALRHGKLEWYFR